MTVYWSSVLVWEIYLKLLPQHLTTNYIDCYFIFIFYLLGLLNLKESLLLLVLVYRGVFQQIMENVTLVNEAKDGKNFKHV